MTTCEQIYKILKNPEKEKLKIELKTSIPIRTADGQSKLGYEIVAFANRHGGKLILGINDDGSFEGKKIFDIDTDKGILDDICHTKISPSIDYSIEYLECDKGDILIINIEKRKGIPHAFIVKREGPEIKNRIYYIRTEHGKRLVNDIQLDWLFKNQDDLKIFFPFHSVVHFPTGVPGVYHPLPQPKSTLDYMALITGLSEIEKAKLKNDTGTLSTIFVQISPYALLRTFSQYFWRSWIIQLQRRKNKTYWQEAVIDDDIKTITIDELSNPINKSAIPVQTWDFKSLLKKSNFSTISLPKNTKIEIEFNNMSSNLTFRHPDFNFVFYFSTSSAGPGLFGGHPFHENTHPINEIIYPVSHDIMSRHHKLNGMFRYIDLDCVFNTTFEFPENDIESFQNYYGFGENIQNILKNDWDFDTFIQNYPSQEIFSIDNKLTEVLKCVNKPQKKSE
jgi:hypothetical protein